jgi:signal transduction histidine kinase
VDRGGEGQIQPPKRASRTLRSAIDAQSQEQVYVDNPVTSGTVLPEGTDASASEAGHVPEVSQEIRETSSRYLEALITSTPDAMIAINQQFKIIELNPAATKALGPSLGRPCYEVLCCHNLNRMRLCGTSSCPLTRVLQTPQPVPNEEMIIGAEPDHQYEVSVSITPISTADGPCVAFTARDVSALKIANRARSNFVSMVSHELRTPLNSVHGFIDLLLQGHMGELTEEQHTYLGYAQEGVQQLISIVEDILFMTRSDLGQFEIKQQEVQLQGLVRQVMNNLQLQARKAEVVLVHDMPSPSPVLYADPQRVKQVLNNLLSNAIKFTPPGGTVTVRVRPYDERFAMISVIDTGYGIPVEDRPHIFERFYQSNHSAPSKMGGYGLGLSIAQLIVEQHGGTISFDTVLNKGTTFYFTLPLKK